MLKISEGKLKWKTINFHTHKILLRIVVQNNFAFLDLPVLSLLQSPFHYGFLVSLN